MSNKYPFHYEVRFKLLAFDSDNNVRIESFTKVFDYKNPLENRKSAFEEFNEYLSFIETDRLRRNKQGNYYMIQPSCISEKLKQKEKNKDSISLLKEYDQFKEEISVFYS